MAGLRLKALTAEEAVQRFQALGPVFGSETVQWRIQTNVPGLSLNYDGQASTLSGPGGDFLALVKGRDQVIVQSASLKGTSPERGITYDGGDQVVARLEMVGTFKTAAISLKLFDDLTKVFDVLPQKDLVALVGSKELQRDAMILQEAAVSSLQQELAKLGTFLAKIAEEDAKQRRELNAKLENDHREKLEKLNAEYQDKFAALETQRSADKAALASERTAFLEEKGQFNTNEAKFVRRKLLEELKTVLKESETLKLSEDTRKKRHWVHGFTWVLLAVSLAFAAAMGWKFFDTTLLRFAGAMSAGSITFVTTLVYYLKWNDRWFREHSDGEFASKRYKSDIIRASWLAELAFERTQAGQDELPETLQEAFTRNLFLGSTAIAEAEHPFDQIASLVKRAKKIRVDRGGFALSTKRRKRTKSEPGET